MLPWHCLKFQEFQELLLYLTVLGRRSSLARHAALRCAAGVPGSSTKPYVRSEGRKFERARGRRKSKGYKA